MEWAQAVVLFVACMVISGTLFILAILIEGSQKNLDKRKAKEEQNAEVAKNNATGTDKIKCKHCRSNY